MLVWYMITYVAKKNRHHTLGWSGIHGRDNGMIMGGEASNELRVPRRARLAYQRLYPSFIQRLCRVPRPAPCCLLHTDCGGAGTASVISVYRKLCCPGRVAQIMNLDDSGQEALVVF